MKNNTHITICQSERTPHFWNVGLFCTLQLGEQDGFRMDYKMKYKTVYLSEFSDVFYVVEKNVVLVHWKKYCELEQYRTPLENALKVIKDHSGCNYVADTRDGFEDNPRDTEWVAGYFMPKAKEYGCQIIYFIIDKSNSLKEELEGQEKDSSKLLEFRYIYGMDEI